jgi:hypothetical protein
VVGVQCRAVTKLPARTLRRDELSRPELLAGADDTGPAAASRGTGLRAGGGGSGPEAASGREKGQRPRLPQSRVSGDINGTPDLALGCRRRFSGAFDVPRRNRQPSPSGEGRAEGRGALRLDHVGAAPQCNRERNGGSLATPAGRLYAKAAISVAADWRLMVAGAASGAS